MRMVIAALAFVLGIVPAIADTYFAVLGAGPGGAACTSTATVPVDASPVPTDGTCNGCVVITKAQYDACQSAITTVASADSSTVQGLLQTGVTVTFTLTPSASGSYSANQGALASLEAKLNRFAITGTFPGGGSTLQVMDTAKPPVKHTLTAAQAKALYGILQDYASGVADAIATAVANKTAPVYPVATAASAL